MNNVEWGALIALVLSTSLTIVTLLERLDARRKRRREGEAEAREAEQKVDLVGMSGIRVEWKNLFNELVRQNAARLVQINKDREADRQWYEQRISDVEQENRDLRDEHKRCQQDIAAIRKALRDRGITLDDQTGQNEAP